MAAAATLFSPTTSSGPLLLLKFRPSSPRLHSSLHHQNSHCLIFPSTPNRVSLPSLRSTSRPPPPPPHRRSVFIASAQSNLFKVIQRAWRIGKDGIEAGTDLVPDSVPRPVARISIAVVALTVGLFLLKSFLSTAFFVLAMMGFIYFVYMALNKDEGPRGGGGGGSGSSSSSGRSPSTDEEALNEVRRIMDKYK